MMSITALIFLVGGAIMVYIAIQTLKQSNMKIASDLDHEGNIHKRHTQEEEQAFDKVMKRVDDALQEGKYHDAEAALETALRMSPENEEVLSRLAYVLEHQGDTKAAKATYEQALKIHPKSAELNAAYASMLKKEGDLDQAKTYYIEAVSLSDDNALIYYNFSNLLVELGEMDAAKQGYQHALDIDPDFKEAREALSAISMKRLES